jgi:hypothetical protein
VLHSAVCYTVPYRSNKNTKGCGGEEDQVSESYVLTEAELFSSEAGSVMVAKKSVIIVYTAVNKYNGRRGTTEV